MNDAFFAAALLQERVQALAATIAELEARLHETNVRVREGAALPADAAAVEASLLQRRQDDDALRATRQSALKRLSNLTGRDIGEDIELASPDSNDAVAHARRENTLRSRPEFVEFARTQERLRARAGRRCKPGPAAVVSLRQRRCRPPRAELHRRRSPGGTAWSDCSYVGAHGRGARRGANARRLACNNRSLPPTRRLSRRDLPGQPHMDSTSIDCLQRAVTIDDRIVELREQIVRTSEVRFREGALTASEYVDRSTDLLEARFARAGHRVELAEASARFLTTLGLEVR